MHGPYVQDTSLIPAVSFDAEDASSILNVILVFWIQPCRQKLRHLLEKELSTAAKARLGKYFYKVGKHERKGKKQ